MKQYDSCYKKWWKFCCQKDLHPFSYSISNLFNFLKHILEGGASYSSLNTHRSALSLILTIKTEHEPLIKRFLRGAYNIRPAKPKYSSTWDPSPVLEYLGKLHPLNSLSLENLTKKFVTLMALTTAHRVQTFSKINLDNINKFEDRIEIRISEKIKTSGPNKYQPILILPFFKDKEELCVASAALAYINATKNLRGNEKHLILTYKKPYHPASSQTISRWIKTVLKNSGINTEIYQSHSTRHAATSAAFRSGISIEAIRKTAGWTESSKVFNTFYNKTVTTNSTNFANAILELGSKN